jgi:hypothetical protein
MNNLLQYRSQKQYENVLNLLTDALPDNLVLQTKLDSLITKKSSHIKKLLRKWIKRYLPIYSEKDIRELNLEFLSDKIRMIGDRLTRGYENQCNVDSKSWILKQNSCWLGWNPDDNQYFSDPIEFGGDLNFERNFENLVISDGLSNSINLIWTIEFFLKKGQEMGLCDADWISVFLMMAKKYLPLVFTSLSRHSVNADSLFQELVSQINLDNEVAKLRSALCTICRKHQDQIHISVFRIKSLYQMILSINQPHLTEEKIETRSDYLAISCIQYLVTATTYTQFQTFIQLKAQEQEITGCSEACNFLASQEQASADFQLTATVYLPKPCSMLDLASLEASTINELVINATTKQGPNKDNGWSQNKREQRTPERKDSRRSDGNRRDNRRFSNDRDRGRDKNKYQQEGGQRKDSMNKGYRRQYSSSRERYSERSGSNNSNKRNGSENKGNRDRGQRRGSGDRDRGQRRDSGNRGQRRDSGNRGQGRQRSSSRNRGSPVRLRGCIRCGSDNHKGEECPRFDYWTGPPCSHCGYLHKDSVCPRFTRDRKPDNRRGKGQQVNSTELSSVDTLVQKDTTVKTVLPNLFVKDTKN